MAKRIIEQAGGTIGFESKPGEGAQFFFTLPVSGAAAQRHGPRAEPRQRDARAAGLSLLMFLRTPGDRPTASPICWSRSATAWSAPTAWPTRCERAGKEHFDAIIAGAGDADMLAAAPGVKAPLIAVLLRGDRAPAATDSVLRWPVAADAALPRHRRSSAPAAGRRKRGEAGNARRHRRRSPSARLEKSVGIKTLIEILQCYIVTAEQLTNALAEACAEEKWDEAARLAQDIVGAAGGLGLAAVTQAARHFAQSRARRREPP